MAGLLSRGAEELAEALRVNKTLDTLDLGNNQQLGEKRIMRRARVTGTVGH